jgi:hypothetical protein
VLIARAASDRGQPDVSHSARLRAGEEWDADRGDHLARLGYRCGRLLVGGLTAGATKG